MIDNVHRFLSKIHFSFEDHFDYQKISHEHVSFARHYIKNEMGIDLDTETLIEFTPIRATVFGYLIAHLALEYEKYNKRKSEAGFKISPPGEM